jgi:hypothetical protein
LLPSQAQKHVTVNESLVALDAVVQGAVSEMGRNAPPAAPAEGDRFLIGGTPTGAWVGRAGNLAHFRNNLWYFQAPQPGWRLYNLADDTLYVLTTALAWVPLSGGGTGGGGAISELQEATRIGLGMTADPGNPFAAKLNAALFTARTVAEGGNGDLFVTANKATAADDAGFVFQQNFVTRAIAGLFGSNRFRIAVSPNGSAFNDAISVHEASGIVDQPRLPRFKGYTNFDNVCPADVWTKIAINVGETNEQGTFDPTTNRFTAPVAGTYCFGASLVYKQMASANARMRGRLAVNGSTEIRGSFGEISGAHVSNATGLWLHALANLGVGDTVELQGSYRTAEAAVAAEQTTFWGFKVG